METHQAQVWEQGVVPWRPPSQPEGSGLPISSLPGARALAWRWCSRHSPWTTFSCWQEMASPDRLFNFCYVWSLIRIITNKCKLSLKKKKTKKKEKKENKRKSREDSKHKRYEGLGKNKEAPSTSEKNRVAPNFHQRWGWKKPKTDNMAQGISYWNHFT